MRPSLMKRYLGFSVVLLCGALIGGVMPGCVAPESSRSTTVVQSGGDRPLEVQPPARGRGRPKTIVNASPIVISKAATTPTPTPSAKAKSKVGSKAKGVPTGTSVPFYFGIESAFWPTGVDSVYSTIKCFEVTSISGSPAITLSSTALAVFGTTATSKSITLTPGATVQVNMTFPTSLAGKTLAVIITGEGEDPNANVYNFSGVNIFVVNP
ncbi:hypothetical protein ACXR0O_03985 [Verrucomicrobiota bacterium sgz303538]